MFLCVWMHVVQFVGKESFDNELFVFIYSFHMPLFMIISGYLFFKKINNGIIENTIQGLKRYILPNICWGIIFLILFDYSDISIGSILNLPLLCWFLVALFFSQLVFSVSSRLFVRFPILCVCIISIVISLIPGSEYCRYMVPFFGLGILTAKYSVFDKIVANRYLAYSVILITILFQIFWKPEYTIYITSLPNINCIFDVFKWKAFAMRIAIGTLMTYTLYTVINRCQCSFPLKKEIVNISIDSLGIYIIHQTLLTHIETYLPKMEASGFCLDLICLVITIPFIILIQLIIKLIRRNSIASLLLLGVEKRYNEV